VVPIDTVHAGRRHRVGRIWFSCEVAYVLAITTVAAVGMSTGSRRPLVLVATVLALPCGAGALVGLYVLTGLFNWMAAGFSTYSWSQSTGGCAPDGHCWTRTWGTPVGARGLAFVAYVVALYSAAAITNVLIVRQVVRGRGAHAPGADPAAMSPGRVSGPQPGSTDPAQQA
jgi:hypothetical protein